MGGNNDRAHARRTDRETSHLAAAAVTPGLPMLQAAVEKFALSRPHGFFDVDLYADGDTSGASTLRTRRAELTERNIVLDSMRRGKPPGATTPHTIWIHRAFVEDAPPVCDAPRPERPAGPVSENLAREAQTAATDLLGFARSLKDEGRGPLGSRLEAIARLLQDVSTRL